MFLLISPAKTFATKAKVPRDLTMTSPRFLEEARTIMASVLRLSREELASMLQLSPKLRDEVYARLRTFFDPEVTEMPAALSYTGMVFRKLSPSTFTAEDWAYAAEHLHITSFVYGLLSPETAIRYDRMEGAVQLPDLFDGRLFDYWRDRLTPYLIEAVKRAGGTLLFLASDEMRGLFHWAEVERAVRSSCASLRDASSKSSSTRRWRVGRWRAKSFVSASRKRKPCVRSLPRALSSHPRSRPIATGHLS